MPVEVKKLKPIKTLLVEDDPDLVDVAVSLLELTGCEVTPVFSPEEAIEKFQDVADFELLFTDYRFPSALTGTELADQVTVISSNIKVIIATGFDRETIQNQANENYCVIYKPYRLEALREILQQLFPDFEN